MSKMISKILYVLQTNPIVIKQLEFCNYVVGKIKKKPEWRYGFVNNVYINGFLLNNFNDKDLVLVKYKNCEERKSAISVYDLWNLPVCISLEMQEIINNFVYYSHRDEIKARKEEELLEKIGIESYKVLQDKEESSEYGGFKELKVHFKLLDKEYPLNYETFIMFLEIKGMTVDVDKDDIEIEINPSENTGHYIQYSDPLI